MGVKFSQLYELPTSSVASNDYLAILDTSEGILKRTQANHASTNNRFGQGTSTQFGHVKVSDSYTTEIGAAASGIAASQSALYQAYNRALVMCLTAWVGERAEWEAMSNEEKNQYQIVNILDDTTPE